MGAGSTRFNRPSSIEEMLTIMHGDTRWKQAMDQTILEQRAVRHSPVVDCLSLLDDIKERLGPHTYDLFLDAAYVRRAGIISTREMVRRISILLRGHVDLLQRCNIILPEGCSIDCSGDAFGIVTSVNLTMHYGTINYSAEELDEPIASQPESTIYQPDVAGILRSIAPIIGTSVQNPSILEQGQVQ